MNMFQRTCKKNLNSFILRFVDDVYAKKNGKKGKFYKRTDGRFISHRALMGAVRKTVKKRIKSGLPV